MSYVELIIEFLKVQGISFIAKLSGWRAALAKLVFDGLIKELRKVLIYFEQKAKAKKEAEEYKEKLKDETRAPEEIRKDDRDFLK